MYCHEIEENKTRLKDDEFLQTLAEGGLHVGELAKLYFPGGHDIPDYETGEEYIADGGTAMMAWSRMQFDDISQPERDAVFKALLEYCELDTLAMVMIYQHWEFLNGHYL